METLADLRGVGLYEENKFGGMSVSMAGGGYLNIAAKDNAFDNYALSNQLSFTTSDVTFSDITLALPLMSGKFFHFGQKVFIMLILRNRGRSIYVQPNEKQAGIHHPVDLDPLQWSANLFIR